MKKLYNPREMIRNITGSLLLTYKKATGCSVFFKLYQYVKLIIFNGEAPIQYINILDMFESVKVGFFGVITDKSTGFKRHRIRFSDQYVE